MKSFEGRVRIVPPHVIADMLSAQVPCMHGGLLSTYPSPLPFDPIALELGIRDSRAALNESGLVRKVRCMERVARYGAQIDAIECAEMSALLGAPVASVAEGFEKLDPAILAHRIPDEQMVRYLTRRAFRSEWLYQPCADLCPGRKWARL